jgi:fumarate reductase subunit C
VKPYSRPPEFAWWLTNRAYFFFVVRELTSVFIAAYVVVLLLLLRRIAAGPQAYAAFLQGLRSPGMLVFHLAVLAAAVYHSITWFRLAPLALPLRLGGRRVSGRTVVAATFALWAALSLAVAWIVLRG